MRSRAHIETYAASFLNAFSTLLISQVNKHLDDLEKREQKEKPMSMKDDLKAIIADMEKRYALETKQKTQKSKSDLPYNKAVRARTDLLKNKIRVGIHRVSRCIAPWAGYPYNFYISLGRDVIGKLNLDVGSLIRCTLDVRSQIFVIRHLGEVKSLKKQHRLKIRNPNTENRENIGVGVVKLACYPELFGLNVEDTKRVEEVKWTIIDEGGEECLAFVYPKGWKDIIKELPEGADTIYEYLNTVPLKFKQGDAKNENTTGARSGNLFDAPRGR
jgi:hypothetical protein